MNGARRVAAESIPTSIRLPVHRESHKSQAWHPLGGYALPWLTTSRDRVLYFAKTPAPRVMSSVRRIGKRHSSVSSRFDEYVSGKLMVLWQPEFEEKNQE
jgi:hypothetical protein